MKSGELAARLNVSDSLIRKWSGQYTRLLSKEAGRPKPGMDREFDDKDALTMATISHLRNEGKSHDEIEQELAAGWRVEELPPLPSPEVDDARARVSLVPVDSLRRAMDRVSGLESEITRLVEERDRLLDDWQAEQKRAEELRHKIGRLEGRLEQVPKLEAEIERLRSELAEARKRRGLFG